MEITYIFRTPSNQRSIERVFEPIIDQMKKDGHSVDTQFARSGRNLFSTLWKNMRYFSKLSKSRLCHITGDVQYVACMMNPDNTILTIHDLVPLHNKNVPWYSKLLCYWLWYYIPLRRLKIVTCISESTRQDLISFFPWAKDKLVVVPNPVDPTFKFVSKDFLVEYPRILHIGTKSNKNLIRVIEALDGIPCHLRIIGKIPSFEKQRLTELGIDYSNEEFVTDSQIVQEYIDCDIVSFPSLFEGFGMPIIEGQSTGRIVLTSELEPMKSVAGEGAIFVDAYSVESIRHAFKNIISNQDDRNNVAVAGIKNSRQYTISAIYKKYNNIYDQFMTV